MKWTKKQRSILLVVSVTSFMGTFLLSAVNIALPAIERSFGLDAISLSWVITSFLLANAMFMLPAGKWGDLSGNLHVFNIGLIIFTLGSLFCAMAPGGGWLIAARFIQGAGIAFSSTTGLAILMIGFPAKQRGQVIGCSVASVYGGLALGPFFGGLLTQHLGWRSLFYLTTMLGLISILVTFLSLKKEVIATKEKQPLDIPGAIVFMLGLSALVYGSSITPTVAGWTLMTVGAALLCLFWRIESRADDPLFDTKLFTENKLFAYSNLATLINYTATFAIILFLSLYLQKIKALSPQQAGSMIIVQPIVMALFSPLVGRLSDKIQPRYFTTLGMVICAIGLLAFSFLTETTPMWVILVILFGEGVGFALFSSPNMSSIMSAVDRSKYGLASGSASSMRMIGQIFGMTIVTLFFAYFFSGRAIEAIPNALFLSTIRWGFLTFTLICIPGIYFSATRGNLKRGNS